MDKCVLLGIFTAMIAIFMTAAALAQLPGDINDNCTIDSDDLSQLVGHLLLDPALTGGPLDRADANLDSGVDAADGVWIVNHQGNLPLMVPVMGGSFDMGDPWGEGTLDQRPVHTVTLSDYLIGRTEVTNAEYVAFLNSALAENHITLVGSAVYPASGTGDLLCSTHGNYYTSQIDYSEGTFSVRSRGSQSMADYPVTDVTWYGAVVYCNWLSRQEGLDEVYTESGGWASDLSRNGYHLPTEAQWERAAGWDPDHSDPTAGGHWRYAIRSDSIDQTRANYQFADPMGFGMDILNWPLTAPVGYYSNSACSLCCRDMSGNVMEWCNDWLDLDYYSSSPGTDPEGPSTGTDRVIRGGSWAETEYTSRTATRFYQTPSTWNEMTGFRLARNP